MPAPRLVPAHADRVARLPEALRGSADAVFLVVEAGEFAGERYAAGDLVVCRAPVGRDAPVVLVARGFGRPRLGWVRENGVYGDVGEPCSPERWRPVGRISAVLRAASETRSPSPARLGGRAGDGSPLHRRPEGQLALFAARAA